MTRGRENNTAHLVAENLEDARKQWIEAFGRDRADLGPGHARSRAIDDIGRYGPTRPRRGRQVPPSPSPAAMRPAQQREDSAIGL